VRLKDVARIELGAQAYATSARLNGKPSTGIGVQLSPSGNALATADARLVGPDGTLYAHATTTCLVFDLPP
jgi:hypothetical protein